MVKKYGLWTSIAMIVGIVIGSGIFFKADKILLATGGNVTIAVIALVVSAISIIFGSLTISRLAVLTDRSGGAIAYYEQFYAKPIGAGFGWFQTFMYFPILVSVIGYVVGVYICLLVGIEDLGYQILVGLAVMVLLYAINIMFPKFSGGVQVTCMIAKLIPLALIAGFGLIMGGFSFATPSDEFIASLPSVSTSNNVFLSALLPIVFSYDGWIVATSISREIKNEKRNLPLAMIIAPIIVLAVYVMYFLGLVKMVGIEHILTHSGDYLYYASEKIFGANGKIVILLFVVVSVIGTLNGLILGHIRLPQSLQEKGLLAGDRYQKVSKAVGENVNAGVIALTISLVWVAVNYVVMKLDWLPGHDISELVIVSQYLLFILLYVKVFLLFRKRVVKGVLYGVICPLLAIVGAGLIFVCGFVTWQIFLVGLAIVVVVFTSGALLTYYRMKNGKLKEYHSELNKEEISEEV